MIGLVSALTLLVSTVLLGPGAAPAQAAERTVTYTVSTQGSVQGDVNHFADVARQTLSDPRGWTLRGSVAFQPVASGSDFDLILASPQVVGNAAPGCSSQWSCRVGRSVYINDDRWRFGTDAWPHGLASYQQYVILHEVGHWVGVGHTDCPTPGRTAWLMQQQSISLQGCRANLWPVIAERGEAGRLLGVPVYWSAIDGRYMDLGQEGGWLGPPVGWERFSRDGIGAYQYFARPGAIYWSPSTGPREIYGAILARYRALSGELGPLGYPVTVEVDSADGVGRYQHFSRPDGASIYWTPDTGAREVFGPIRSRWGETGAELGPLGYPVTGVYPVEGGSRTDFQGGSITLDEATGRTEILRD